MAIGRGAPSFSGTPRPVDAGSAAQAMAETYLLHHVQLSSPASSSQILKWFTPYDH